MICEMFHKSSRHRCETMYRTLRRFYMWPGMWKTIKEYTEKCQVCMHFQPVKERAKPLGLPVSLADLNQIDWFVADAFSIKGSNILALWDWCSGYVWARPLKNMEAGTIKEALDELSNMYSSLHDSGLV